MLRDNNSRGLLMAASSVGYMYSLGVGVYAGVAAGAGVFTWSACNIIWVGSGAGCGILAISWCVRACLAAQPAPAIELQNAVAEHIQETQPLLAPQHPAASPYAEAIAPVERSTHLPSTAYDAFDPVKFEPTVAVTSETGKVHQLAASYGTSAESSTQPSATPALRPEDEEPNSDTDADQNQGSRSPSPSPSH